jgi:integrase
VPYFALCLFAGIRPSVPHGEITKLKPEAVDLDAGVISISAEVSKVREPRKVAIQPNLAAWLRAYPLERFPLVVTNFYRRRAKIGKEFGLTHDVMRHSFISMFVAKFRSIGEAAIQAGNSEGIIRRHYLDLKSAEEAEDYWSIVPQRATLQAAPLKVLPVPAFLGARRAKSAA